MSDNFDNLSVDVTSDVTSDKDFDLDFHTVVTFTLDATRC